jgi:CRP-like cAMP-binding protein
VSHRRAFQDQLGAVPLFAGLAPEELAHIARFAARIHEPAGEVLTKEGERGDELMVVLEGEVEVRHGESVLGRLGPGDHLGEIALLHDDARRSATAVATTPVVIAFIARGDFERLLADVPLLAQRVAASADGRRTEAGGPT